VLLRMHAQQHKLVAMGLALALLGVIVLFGQSITQVLAGNAAPGLRLALYGGVAGFATTALGALPALLMRSMPQRVEDSMLGLAAGMMLAASAFSLLLPGLEAAESLLGNRGTGAAVVVFGMALGVLLMLGLDEFTPHEHETTGPCGPGYEICGRVWLFVFAISAAEAHQLQRLYHGVWIVFLVDISLHILLEYKDTRQTFSMLTWILTFLLYLTLVPVVFHRPEVEGAVQAVWDFLNGKAYHLVLLLVLSFLNLSYGLVRLLGRRTNPSLILAVSFFIIILIGTGLLMLPRSTVAGISWVDSLFISTSAVCVTGLTSVDVASTFTTTGFVIIILLIQIGGLGVMTLTSFFAMFFMGNTSLYNQLVVRDMVSSNSLNSLLSTLVYILGFTLVIEGIGTFAIWSDIHGTMGMDVHEELAFSAFHSISAFCNAGFSTLPGNLGNPLLMKGHNPFYIYISLLIILGGIGFPILVNFKDIILYHMRRFWRFLHTWEWDGRRFYHLYNLNTRIVLIVTFLLLAVGTAGIAFFEWNASFAGMSVADKWTQAFFNAACPRTAGFSSVDLAGLGVQTLLLYLILMWIGGGSQSTAGGIKVNAFAVVVLNLVAVLRGTERVEEVGLRRAVVARARGSLPCISLWRLTARRIWAACLWRVLLPSCCIYSSVSMIPSLKCTFLLV
jgi:Trk-type K+ transport system membrane component